MWYLHLKAIARVGFLKVCPHLPPPPLRPLQRPSTQALPHTQKLPSHFKLHDWKMETLPVDTGQFICKKDLMKNFKADSALQRKLVCESLWSLWGEEEEPASCSYGPLYHMGVSQAINTHRQDRHQHSLFLAGTLESGPVRSQSPCVSPSRFCPQCSAF